MHRRLIAGQARKTFKDHIKTLLSGTEESFPVNQFDKLMRQAVFTLNLLRQSNVTPNISAYAYRHGQFDKTKCYLHDWYVKYWCMTNCTGEDHVQSVPAKDGTLAYH